MDTHDMKVVTFGEIMMRLSPPRHLRFDQAHAFDVFFGGSEANVAACLAAFGIQTEHVTRFPGNDLGASATRALRSLGVGTSHLIHGPERMGLYFLETGAMHRPSRIIYDRINSTFANITPGMIDWDEILASASWFHWTGITPAISQGAATVCLDALRSAKKNGLVVSGDINYRRNLWQYGRTARDVMPELISFTDHVVAGAADIENCTGIIADGFLSAASGLSSMFPNVLSVSATNRTSVTASHNEIEADMYLRGHHYRSASYSLNPIVDRIGTGDAFMGGLIYGWLMQMDPQNILEFATASCAWKHSVEGDVNIASAKEIERLMKGENTGKLLR
jgi:2-dehydro-3-deoxygluconokinase